MKTSQNEQLEVFCVLFIVVYIELHKYLCDQLFFSPEEKYPYKLAEP